MPSYGCQVIVQSEDEKQLRKQVRKEEKKVQKLLKTRQDQDRYDFTNNIFWSQVLKSKIS